jgi:serine protease Do
MRRELLFVAGAVGLLATSCGPSKDPHSPRMRMTPKDIVQQSSDGIVVITAGDDKIGSGFIVNSTGLVATNLHVVASEKQITVKLHDGSSSEVTEVVGYDPDRDLALLRIKPGKSLSPLRLGDSDQMSAGDQIVAIGNPLGVFEYSVSSGLVSQRRTLCTKTETVVDKEGNKRERRCPTGGFELLQISAPISQGSSGGPLFNQYGEVIGVTTAIIQAGQSINLAVPTNYLKTLIAQPAAIPMERFAKETSPEDDGLRGKDDVKITRMVPTHPVTVLDGCSDAQVVEVVQAITAAIDIGAPLYNQGMSDGSPNASGMEACFRIYEGTSTKLERDPPCKGVGKAFGDGLLRASSMSTFKEKAWALRDTFDGMIEVAVKRGVKPGSKP